MLRELVERHLRRARPSPSAIYLSKPERAVSFDRAIFSASLRARPPSLRDDYVFPAAPFVLSERPPRRYARASLARALRPGPLAHVPSPPGKIPSLRRTWLSRDSK